MKQESNNFVLAASIGIANADMQAAVRSATNSAAAKRLNALFAHSIEHGEAMRMQAAAIKRRALRDLPELLEQAENGITVLWAENAGETNDHVLEIAKRHDVQNVVKAKSMVSEETALNHFLEEHGLNVVESDLGEFIAQLDDEPPSHIVMPMLHKSKASVRDLFVEKLEMSYTDDAEEMTAHASWHISQRIREWIRAYNHAAKAAGEPRLLVYGLPSKSPWLNPIEPCWVHAKRSVCEPDGELTSTELRRRLAAHFNTQPLANTFKL